VKKGIYEVTVINVASGRDKPNIAMKNATIIRNIIGKISWCTSSTRLTSERSIAAIVAYNKEPSTKNNSAYTYILIGAEEIPIISNVSDTSTLVVILYLIKLKLTKKNNKICVNPSKATPKIFANICVTGGALEINISITREDFSVATSAAII